MTQIIGEVGPERCRARDEVTGDLRRACPISDPEEHRADPVFSDAAEEVKGELEAPRRLEDTRRNIIEPFVPEPVEALLKEPRRLPVERREERAPLERGGKAGRRDLPGGDTSAVQACH